MSHPIQVSLRLQSQPANNDNIRPLYRDIQEQQSLRICLAHLFSHLVLFQTHLAPQRQSIRSALNRTEWRQEVYLDFRIQLEGGNFEESVPK